MRTLAFVTQKGGSGKSTLASSIAVAAMESGEAVAIVDLDQRATLRDWAQARGLDDVPVILGDVETLSAILQDLQKKGVTLVVLDTPGADGPEAAAAMKVADLSIIPARPTMFDLWGSSHTRATLKEMGGEFAFVLNQCPPAQQSARIAEGVEALEELGGLLSPLIQSRVDYQEAARYGWGVTEINAHGAAAEEIRGLWTSIKKRIGKARTRQALRKAA